MIHSALATVIIVQACQMQTICPVTATGLSNFRKNDRFALIFAAQRHRACWRVNVHCPTLATLDLVSWCASSSLIIDLSVSYLSKFAEDGLAPSAQQGGEGDCIHCRLEGHSSRLSSGSFCSNNIQAEFSTSAFTCGSYKTALH